MGVSVILPDLLKMLDLSNKFLKNMLEFALDWNPLITIIVSFLTLRMVFKNYNLTYKKNSYSTISIKAKKIKTKNIRSIFEPVDLSSENKYVNLANDDDIYFDRSKYGSLKPNFSQGFPISNQYHDSYDWYLDFKNIGDFPSTNITIEFEIHIHKLIAHSPSEEYESIEINHFELTENKTIKKTFVIPYMAADEEKKLFICTLKGEFPKASLYVKKLYSTQLKFIDEFTLIDVYRHPSLEIFDDSNIGNLLELAGYSPVDSDINLGPLTYSRDALIDLQASNLAIQRKPNVSIDEKEKL